VYEKSKLSEPRDDDHLPPLTLYLEDKLEIEKREMKKKAMNPDYEDLFADNPEAGKEIEKPEPKKEGESSEDEPAASNIPVDPRNSEDGIGFVDVMGFKIRLKDHDNRTQPW